MNDNNEEWIEEFDKEWDWIEEYIADSGYDRYGELKDFFRKTLQKQTDATLEKVADAVGEIGQGHACRFNDEPQQCDCFYTGRNEAIEIIRSHLSTKDK